MKISVIIPMYNESKIIAKNITKLDLHLKKSFDNYEIILVDDGSRDMSSDYVKNENTFIIFDHTNCGKGSALRQGIKYADGDYIFFTDADLSYPLDFFENSIKYFENYNIVCGRRIGNYPFFREFISFSYDNFIKLVLGINLKNIQCGIKGFKKETAKKLFSISNCNRFSIDTEIIFLAQKSEFKIKQIPVEINHRKNSHISFTSDTFNMINNAFKIKQRYKKGGYNV